MVHYIQLWIKEINNKQSLLLLLDKVSFTFRLIVESKKMTIKISNGLILIEENNDSIKKVLKGKEENILSVLSGKRRLSQAVKDNIIYSTITYRELLLLDSLFYLAKKKSESPLNSAEDTDLHTMC